MMMSNKSSTIPRNPTSEELAILMDEKHHELMGNICHDSHNNNMCWQEMHTKDGIRLSRRDIQGAPETCNMRKIEVTIKASPERIASVVCDSKKIFKIMMEVETC